MTVRLGRRQEHRLIHACRIGDRWRCRNTGYLWTVRQIYRPDRLALITCDSLDGACRRIVSGTDLAANFVWHADRQVNPPGSRKTAA